MSAGRVPRERERDFQWAVIEPAQLCGWKVAHFRAARTKDGWRTPVAADGPGWPDRVLVRERIIFAECKSQKGRLRLDQKEWQTRLKTAGAEVYVWRPANWDTIESLLTAEAPPRAKPAPARARRLAKSATSPRGPRSLRSRPCW